MNVKIDPTWKEALASQWESEEFRRLTDFVRSEYATQQVFPPAGRIFAAFDACPFDKVKVVILGQDPYHDVGQATGMCFSVNPGVPMPPSLVNIFREVHDDTGAPIPADGDLTRWARQGVLLLNATLTVRAHRPASHAGKGWEAFTDAALPMDWLGFFLASAAAVPMVRDILVPVSPSGTGNTFSSLMACFWALMEADP